MSSPSGHTAHRCAHSHSRRSALVPLAVPQATIREPRRAHEDCKRVVGLREPR
jgi:hypothetical protein